MDPLGIAVGCVLALLWLALLVFVIIWEWWGE